MLVLRHNTDGPRTARPGHCSVSLPAAGTCSLSPARDKIPAQKEVPEWAKPLPRNAALPPQHPSISLLPSALSGLASLLFLVSLCVNALCCDFKRIMSGRPADKTPSMRTFSLLSFHVSCNATLVLSDYYLHEFCFLYLC